MVLWASPPYPSVSTFSIHTVSFLCALGSFPFTFMPYCIHVLSAYTFEGDNSVYAVVGEESKSVFFPSPFFFFCQPPPWVFFWLILPRFQAFSLRHLSGLHSLFAARRWPLICFVLSSDGLASLVITCSFKIGCLVWWWIFPCGWFLVNSGAKSDTNASTEAHVEVLCSNPDVASRRQGPWVGPLDYYIVIAAQCTVLRRCSAGDFKESDSGDWGGAQWVQVLAAKPDVRVFYLGCTRWKDRIDSQKWLSGLRELAMARMPHLH